jgi:hypothetical protein
MCERAKRERERERTEKERENKERERERENKERERETERERERERERVYASALTEFRVCCAYTHNIGPYALYVGLGKRKGDKKQADSFVGGDHGVALLRFGFDEWHLPESGEVVIKKAKYEIISNISTFLQHIVRLRGMGHEACISAVPRYTM